MRATQSQVAEPPLRPAPQRHIEGQALARPPEQPGHDDQVPGAADGQKLTEPLEHTEDEGARGGHVSRGLD